MAGRLVAVVAFLLLGLLPSRLQAQQPVEPVLPDSTADAAYSPRGAFVRSLLIPGWGQAAVGAPGRGAVYFTLASSSYVMTWVSRAQLNHARDELDGLRAAGLIDEDATNELVLSRERQFEDWAAISLFLMFLSGADAYVSAYLSDFDDRVGVIPGSRGDLQIRASFPVGGP